MLPITLFWKPQEAVARVDLTAVMEIAGHASLKTTQKYLHSRNERKQKAVDKLSEFGRYLPSTFAPRLVERPVSGRIINLRGRSSVG